MKYLLPLLLVCPLTCCAAGITVSDQLPPPVQYPPEVYRMTPEQFYYWAQGYNRQQREDLEQRRAERQAERIAEGPAYAVTTRATSQTKNRTTSRTTSRTTARVSYAGRCTSNRCYGAWGGPILASRTTTTTTPVVEETTTESVYTPRTWPGLDYGPGPLTIINPYCPPKPEGTEL